MYSLILTLVLLRQMSFLSKSVYWVCEAKLQAGKTFDDLFDLCTANKKDISIILAAFAGILTRTKFMLLIEELQTESYAQARHIAKEQIEKNKLIEGYTLANKVRGSEKEIKKLETVGQKIFAYCPGLDAVLTLKVKRDTPDGEERRQDMFAVGDIITQKIHEGQQQQTNKIEKKVAEATKEAKEYNAKLAAEQLMIQREEAKLRDERLMAHQDQNTAMIVDVVKNNNALAEENRALRLELQEAHERERALQQALPGSSLPELEQAESGQLALQNEHQVEPPSAGSDTLGVTPRTNSVEIRRALGREFSLLRGDRPSPESPESSQEADDDDDAIVEAAPLQGAVAAAALDHETVDEAPLQEATALSPVDAPPPADIASPAPAPAAEDDKGGVKALSTPARPTLERQIASVSRQFWEKHEEGKLRKIKDRTNKPSPLPQPSPPAEEG